MKLLKQLEKMPDDVVIKLGAKNGSGWFYVGTVEELKRFIVIYDDTIRNRWKWNVKSSTERLEKAVANAPTWAGYMQIQAKKNGYDSVDFRFDSYLKSCQRYESRLKKMNQLRKKYETIHEDYIPLEKRDVVSVNESDPCADTSTNIIIEGYEIGNVWTTDEAKERGLQLK